MNANTFYLVGGIIASLYYGGYTEPLLLFGTHKNIRLLDVADQLANTTLVIGDLDDVSALDYVYRQQLIFWTDVPNEVIRMTSSNETKIQIRSSVYEPSRTASTVIQTGLVSPDGLACDWINNKLYWTDSETKRMEVSNLDGSMRAILLWKDLDQPRALTLDPLHGYVYWTDWGEVPKIERAGMDGTHREQLITEDVYWPNGLTLDYDAEQMYWVDAKLHHLHRAALDGSNRQAVLSGQSHLVHPFALTLYGDRVYWTDRETKAIHSCHKITGEDRRTVYAKLEAPMDMHSFHISRQPTGANPCSRNNNNAGCSHLCLLSPNPNGFSCSCPTGVRLLDDGVTCEKGPERLLLLARRGDLRKISLDTKDYTAIMIPVGEYRSGVAVDYDPVDNMVYWSDEKLQTIRRAHLNGSNVQVVISQEIKGPDGLAVDWIARNLYWTDTGTNRIEVCRLNGSSRRILISDNVDEPRAIVVDPAKGYMYWTDWGKPAKIERAALDGSSRQVLINTNLTWPNGLAIDLVQQQLYWSDADRDCIETSRTDGTQRRILLNHNLPHIFGFSLLEDYVYWTDWQERSIERVNKLTGGDREVIIEDLPDLMGLKAVNTKQAIGDNPCAHKNFGCSHLCLMRPMGPICSCPLNQELLPDGKTCIVPDAFLVLARTRQGPHRGADILRISLQTNTSDVVLPLGQMKMAIAMDFDVVEDRLYWVWSDTESDQKQICRVFMNRSSLETVIGYGLGNPESIAVDWMSRNLYWGDHELGTLELARLTGDSRKVLLYKDGLEPYSIALNPMAGLMFWADWDGHDRAIWTATLDCSNGTKLQTGFRAKSLTVDYSEGVLYWVNVDTDQIQYMDPASQTATTIQLSQLQNTAEPQLYSIALANDYIYWADLQRQTIERMHKSMNGEIHVIRENIGHTTDLVVYDSSLQKGRNSCSKDNGNCSHLCIAGQNTATCTCPTHYTLLHDNKTCTAPTEFLLLAQRGSISQLVWNTEEPHVVPVVSLQENKKNIKALSYDTVAGNAYFISGKNIKRIRGNEIQIVVYEPKDDLQVAPYDLAIDSFARLLFWSDLKNNLINVTKLEQPGQPDALSGQPDVLPMGAIVNDSKPRDLAVDPHVGLLFWVNLKGMAQIEKAHTDGRGRLTLFEIDLHSPHDLTLDFISQTIYWLDKLSVQSGKYDGSDRRTIHTSSTEDQFLAAVGSNLYLSYQQHLKKLEEQSQQIDLPLDDLVDMIAISLPAAETIKNAPCKEGSQICSHLCVVQENQNFLCSCPLGLLIDIDGKTCIEHVQCDETELTCDNQQECFPLAFTCDGEADCADQSDEKDCRQCTADEFQCQGSRCLSMALRCDHKRDCPLEGEDELDCPPCPADLFECHSSRNCIPNSMICDTKKDCLSGEDEVNCQVAVASDRSLPALVVVLVVFVLMVTVAVVLLWVRYCYTKSRSKQDVPDCKPLKTHKDQATSVGYRIPQNKLVFRGAVASSLSSPVYDRNHVTGASSTSSAEMNYPNELLNPPPSPANSEAWPRQKKRRKSRGQSKLSDSTSTYSGIFYPPPPTPHSNIHASGPPSPPSTEQSAHINPYPPPPSPVTYFEF